VYVYVQNHQYHETTDCKTAYNNMRARVQDTLKKAGAHSKDLTIAVRNVKNRLSELDTEVQVGG